MRGSSGQGFTLVGLMVALGLGLVVAGLVHRQLLLGRRQARAQLERIAMQDNVRVAALALAGELGPTGYDEIGPGAAAAVGSNRPGTKAGFRASRYSSRASSRVGTLPGELDIAAEAASRARPARSR